MTNQTQILVINASSQAANHLAAALAEQNILSKYVRPYVNLERKWERYLAKLPGIGRIYSKTFGRRRLSKIFTQDNLHAAAVGLDMALALHHRIPINSEWYRGIRKRLIYWVGEAIAVSGESAFSDENVVVASWDVALPAFRKAAQHNAVRVLNYPLAHHAFTQSYLREEAELVPAFSSTLNSHDLPQWKIDRRDEEIELADYILVGSKFVKDTFVAEGVPEEKMVVIPYGADTSLFRPNVKQNRTGRFNVLFVGQLTQRKGISYLLQAYELFHDVNTSLTMIGQTQDDGTSLRPWEHLFTHYSHMPRGELAHRFREADVFIFPTLVEGMPIVVIEAMASGLPVITTPNGPGDIVRDGVDGFIVSPRDPEAILDKLNVLRSDPELRWNMGRNAVERTKEYSWDVYKQRTIEHLKKWSTDK